MAIPRQAESPHRQQNRVDPHVGVGVDRRIELPCHFSELGNQADLVVVTGDDENRHVGSPKLTDGLCQTHRLDRDIGGTVPVIYPSSQWV